MKKSIATAWVAALRSGKFKQGTGALLDKSTGEKCHCCLGVLCTLSPWKNTYDRMEGEDANGVLPKKIRDWAGMRDQHGKVTTVIDENPFTTGEVPTTLVTLNDKRRWTFTQIADLIEKKYEQL